jgi:hypothetical protein
MEKMQTRHQILSLEGNEIKDVEAPASLRQWLMLALL